MPCYQWLPSLPLLPPISWAWLTLPAVSVPASTMQTREEVAKRTQLLLQIATSGLKVEEEMEKHASELDFACVRLMEKRVEAAHR